MLNVAEKKGIYVKFHNQFFGIEEEQRLKTEEDGAFDSIVVSGSYVKGHLPVNSVREAARLLKAGIF